MGTATQPPEFLLISRTGLHKRNLDAFFLYQHTEIPALIVKLDDVVDTSADEPYIERFRNDVRRAEVIRPGQRFVGGVRADDENRYIVYIFIVHQVFQHAESIHYRHHDVQQNRAQLVFVFLKLFYARLPFSASTTVRSLNVSLSISRLNSKSSTMSRVLRSSIYVSPLRMPVGK